MVNLRTLDFARIAQYLALDVNFDIVFGRPFAFLENDWHVDGYIQPQDALLPIIEWFSTFPFHERLTRNRWISRILLQKTTDRKGL